MRVYIVLPEAFRANAWVRSAADRLAAQMHPALAVPLFARTPPGLELAYDTSDSAVGRHYKCATNSWQILIDVAASASWFRARYPRLPSAWWHAAVSQAVADAKLSAFDLLVHTNDEALARSIFRPRSAAPAPSTAAATWARLRRCGC